ncbi:MAG: AMP-binding protein [Propionibacteriales bacterium]|nr:AMP-binding protein [Propionibacteriales bacterium]
MREFSTPLATEIADIGNLTDDVVRAAEEHPDAVTFERLDGGRWHDVTAARFRDQVTDAAKGLMAAGIAPGDRVALMSATRYEWTLLDYAIWWVGATTVPIYETSSAEQVRWILSDSAAVACIAETTSHLSRIEEVRGDLVGLKHLWCIEGGAVEELTAAGEPIGDDELEGRRSAVGPRTPATLIYTSGTTGRPKGCVLTHGNFMFEVSVAVAHLDELFENDEASTLLFLPLAHVFARVIQVGCVRTRVRLGHASDMAALVDALGAFRPTFILAVPRVFEKVFNSASQKAHAEGRGRIFDTAVNTAIRHSQARDRSRGRMSPLLRVRHRLFDRLVYRRLRAALGGRTEYAVSGGAPLGTRLAHFFRGIGVPVLEGYGLTETTAAVTVNRPGSMRIGTVGQPLQGTEVRVGEDGELWFKGGQVFGGYWQDEPATREAIDDDGWFRTGDVGDIDDDGFVSITGRMKEILVTAGGKNVAPSALEDVVRAHPLVSQCMVVGEARPYVAALVTIDPDTFAQWRKERGKRGGIADLVDDPDLVADIQRAVDEANALVSRAEAIRRFAILPDDWTVDSGHLTPTLKVKRSILTRELHDEIEALYG